MKARVASRWEVKIIKRHPETGMTYFKDTPVTDGRVTPGIL